MLTRLSQRVKTNKRTLNHPDYNQVHKKFFTCSFCNTPFNNHNSTNSISIGLNWLKKNILNVDDEIKNICDNKPELLKTEISLSYLNDRKMMCKDLAISFVNNLLNSIDYN